MIRAVVFDVGETLVDETRQWGIWADRLGISRLTFFAALGAVIQRGEHHRRIFDLVAPGVDIASIEAGMAATGTAHRIEPQDLYADALPCLASLRAAGILVGIAGNQPHGADEALQSCGLDADFVASSASLGVEKPSADFFDKLIDLIGFPPDQIAYVGDRLDNDILPARSAGLIAIFLRRGPWGVLHADLPGCEHAHARLSSLHDLPPLIAAL